MALAQIAIGKARKSKKTALRAAARYAAPVLHLVRTDTRQKVAGVHYIKRAFDSTGPQALQQAMQAIAAGVEREAAHGPH